MAAGRLSLPLFAIAAIVVAGTLRGMVKFQEGAGERAVLILAGHGP